MPRRLPGLHFSTPSSATSHPAAGTCSSLGRAIRILPITRRSPKRCSTHTNRRIRRAREGRWAYRKSSSSPGGLCRALTECVRSVGSHATEMNMTSRRDFLKCALATGTAFAGAPTRGEAQDQNAIAEASPLGTAGGALDGLWLARPFNSSDDGRVLSAPDSDAGAEWIRAIVPGTVLTTMLANRRIPDPYFGLNNYDILDAHDVGGLEAYTWWFRTRVDVPRDALRGGKRAVLEFRGINYAADAYLNGLPLTPEPWKGMFLRRQVDVTPLLRPGESNVLAV